MAILLESGIKSYFGVSDDEDVSETLLSVVPYVI